jgi:hypothetical protein
MTVCVAALCDNGASCVVAADRMGVYGQGSDDEFMMDDRANKIHKLSDTAVLLHSGANRDLKEILLSLEKGEKGESMVARLDRVAGELISARRAEFLKRTFGDTIGYKDLTERALTSPAGPLLDTWQKLQKFDVGYHLLVTWDTTGARIHFAAPPLAPTLVELDYFAIGSGGRYARAALTIQQYSKNAPFAESMFHVYSAKRAAEIVYGVGRPTDMGVLRDGAFHPVSAATLEMLEDLRNKKRVVLDDEQAETLTQSLGFKAK